MAPRFREGSGRLCLDFVRTLRNRGTTAAVEELPDAAALLAWINQCGPVHADSAEPGAAATAQILREAVATLLAASRREFGPPGGRASGPPGGRELGFAAGSGLGQAGGREYGPAGRRDVAVDVARQLVNRAAGVAVPVPALDADGRLRWRAAEPVAATLSLIARDALDLVTSPALTRLRECANPDCGAPFVDNSRPGMRRWCSMGTCGNRAKKERAAASR